MSEELTADLLELLGDDGFFSLVEALGGLRVYIPGDINRSELPTQIGYETSARLSKAYTNGYIRVPLAREFRVRRYIDAGMSNRDIAIRFGLTEAGVAKLIKRARERKPLPSRRKKDPRQIEMF